MWQTVGRILHNCITNITFHYNTFRLSRSVRYGRTDMTRLIVAYLRLPLVTHQNQRIFLFMSSRQSACGRFQFPWAHHTASPDGLSQFHSVYSIKYLNSTLNYITTPSRLECIYLSNTTISCVRQVHTLHSSLTLTLLTWRIWWAPNNASKWQMGFSSAFKGLIINTTGMTNLMTTPSMYTHIPIHCSLSKTITNCTLWNMDSVVKRSSNKYPINTH